jgi:osmotically-inducible protein OsmY
VRRTLPLALLVVLGVSAFATEAPENALLKDRIRRDLRSRRYLDPRWVRLSVEHGWVKLTGRVPDEVLHRLVVLAVRNIEGVESVTDAIAVDASLARFELTPLERTRLTVENVRRLLAGDEELGAFSTLSVTRTRRGPIVRGDVSSPSERARIARLAERLSRAVSPVPAPPLGLHERVLVRTDASRRAPAAPPDDATLRFAESVTAALSSEATIAGLVSASVERRTLVLRGTARDPVAGDLALEVARSKLQERQRALSRVRARSGELTRLLGGDPGSMAGEVPETLESFVIVEDTRR